MRTEDLLESKNYMLEKVVRTTVMQNTGYSQFISIFLPSTKLVEFVPLALAMADHDNLEGLAGSTHCVLRAHLRRIATHGTSSNRRETA